MVKLLTRVLILCVWIEECQLNLNYKMGILFLYFQNNGMSKEIRENIISTIYRIQMYVFLKGFNIKWKLSINIYICDSFNEMFQKGLYMVKTTRSKDLIVKRRP